MEDKTLVVVLKAMRGFHEHLGNQIRGLIIAFDSLENVLKELERICKSDKDEVD